MDREDTSRITGYWQVELLNGKKLYGTRVDRDMSDQADALKGSKESVSEIEVKNRAKRIAEKNDEAYKHLND